MKRYWWTGPVGLVLCVVIAVGGWQLGWWIKQASVNRNNHIQHTSYNYQVAQVTDMNNVLSQITGLDTQEAEQPQNKAVLQAQAAALTNQFCSDFESVTNVPVPSSDQSYASSNC